MCAEMNILQYVYSKLNITGNKLYIVTFCIEFCLSAVLMVVAWVGFATVGMFIARYMRPVWGEKNVCGKRMWFQVSYSNTTVEPGLSGVIATLVNSPDNQKYEY